MEIDKINQSYKFDKITEIQEFINKIKNNLTDKSIEQILITKPDDNDIGFLGDFDCESSAVNESIELIISAKAFLKIENLYLGISYERDNYKSIGEKSALSIYVDILFDKPDEDIIDLSHYYSKNILNKKIKDVVVDEYGEINFMLDNGYNFKLDSSYYDEIRLYENKIEKRNQIDYGKYKNILYKEYDLLNQYINTIKPKYVGKKIEKNNATRYYF